MDSKSSERPVLIVGGGIIGLSAAWFLRQAGREVVVLDKGDMRDGCSWGNAGYISPSHFVPLAAPGVAGMALRSMTDSRSPLYLAPRLSLDLLRWGWAFMRSANAAHVRRSGPALRDILLLSRAEYANWAALPGFSFAFDPCGCLELFQGEGAARHAPHTVHAAEELGIAARLLDPDACQALEPDQRMQVRGGIFFADDAQTCPPMLMRQLLERLPQMGVTLRPDCEVKGFKTEGGRVVAVETSQGSMPCTEVLIAAGTWSAQVARPLGIRLPLMPGRGYSLTYTPAPARFRHPVILEDARVAISPMDHGRLLRFGGTMEITPVGSRLRPERMHTILDGVRRFFPDIQLPRPKEEDIWHGYRPLSKDGLPYIGRVPGWQNVVMATGHAMLGLAMGAGTGRLVAELIQGEKPSIALEPFAVGR